MSDLDTTKKQHQGAPEAIRFLGLDKASEDHNSHTSHGNPHKTAPGPSNLPVVDAQVSEHVSTEIHKQSEELGHDLETIEEAAAHQPGWQKAIKAIAPYAAVFVFGLVIYYFFLSNTNFGSIFSKLKPAPKVVQTTKETALQTLENQSLDAYRTWIAQYYFDVSDVAIIDPNADNSGNGLSNFQKYLLNLNPRSYDTLSLGKADSQTLAEGLNPLTASPLTDAQKQIVDKYFDMEVIMNRLAISQLNYAKNNVAGASTQAGNGQNQVIDFTHNQNTNNTLNPRNNQTYVAPKTGADVSLFDSGSNIDQTKPGLLEIPSLKVSAPVIFTKDPKNFDTDLQSGVVHYPGTALPGQIGTTYISGHSSNYIWAKGSYNHVFTKLGELADNASFSITVYTKDGKSIKYHYVVTHRQEYQPTDQAQFQNAGVPTVALSTCWPVNTTQKRLVVYGEQTQIEQ